jgi:hypothetical protein
MDLVLASVRQVLGARVAAVWVEALRREEPDDIRMEKLWVAP